MPRKQKFTLGKTIEAVLMLIVMGAGFVILFPLIAALRIGWYLRDRVADYFQPIYAIKMILTKPLGCFEIPIINCTKITTG